MGSTASWDIDRRPGVPAAACVSPVCPGGTCPQPGVFNSPEIRKQRSAKRAPGALGSVPALFSAAPARPGAWSLGPSLCPRLCLPSRAGQTQGSRTSAIELDASGGGLAALPPQPPSPNPRPGPSAAPASPSRSSPVLHVQVPFASLGLGSCTVVLPVGFSEIQPTPFQLHILNQVFESCYFMLIRSAFSAKKPCTELLSQAVA